MILWSKPVDAICYDKHRAATPVTMVMVTHDLHPLRTAPIAHDSTQPAEQTALHGIPIAPNATKLDTRDWNAVVGSPLNQRMHLWQGMHPQLGHGMGSPDTCLGPTTAALAGVVNRCHRHRQGPQPSRWESSLWYPSQCDNCSHCPHYRQH